MKSIYKILLLFFLIFVIGNSANAAESIPPELEGIGVLENLGHPIPLDLVFKDEQGKEVKLQDYFKPNRPVIITMVYYECPNLCGFLLNGFTDSLKEFPWSPGKEFEVLTISINPTEGPELAQGKKDSVLKAYGRAGVENGWHFLTGNEEASKKLSEALGFKYRYDAEEKQYAHSAAIFVITPDGKISRYLYGIQFPVRDLKFSLIEATQGKIGSVVDKLLMFCYHYDPKGRKYALMATNLMKIGGAVMVLFMAIFLIRQLRAPKVR